MFVILLVAFIESDQRYFEFIRKGFLKDVCLDLDGERIIPSWKDSSYINGRNRDRGWIRHICVETNISKDLESSNRRGYIGLWVSLVAQW